MAYEDYTTFTEYDTDDEITVNSGTLIYFDALERDSGSYVYKDYGQHYFDDFVAENDSIVTAIGDPAFTEGGAVIFAMCNCVTCPHDSDFGYGGFEAYWGHSSGTLINFNINDINNGNSDTCTSVVTNTRYYFIYERSGTTLTCEIYTDAGRTSLLDTLTIQTDTHPFRMLYALSSLYSTVANRSTFTGDVRNLEIISGGEPPPTSPSDLAAEDYTSFTEVDPHGEITVDSSLVVSFVDMNRNNNDYLYKNYGVGYFGDFVHHVNTRCTDVNPQVNWGAGVGIWGMTNAIGAMGTAAWTEGHRCTWGCIDATTLKLDIYDHDTPTVDSWTAPLECTYYYLVIERSGPTLTCKIYQEDERLILLDTLTISCATTTWQYLYGLSNVYSSTANRVRLSGTAEYLKLMEAEVPTEPGEDGPLDGASNAEWPNSELYVDIEGQPGAVNVYFYDASDDSLIGTDSGVNNGESAHTTWAGLDCEETYSWYVVVEYGVSETTSTTWTFTCGTCNVFTIASESYPTIHLSPPIPSGETGQLSKDLNRFGFWSDNWAVHDDGIDRETLVLTGIEWIVDGDDESLFQKKFNDINEIINLREEIAVSGLGDCIDAYYYINNFKYGTVEGSPLARRWTLELEFSRKKTW